MSADTFELISLKERPEEWRYGIDGQPLVAEEPRNKCYWITPATPDQGAEGKPLITASVLGNLAECQRLLEENPECLKERDTNGVSPLIASLMHARFRVAEWLILHGGSELTNAIDSYSNSPIYYAIYLRSPALISLLLDQGAKAQDETQPTEELKNRCIHLAMLSGHVGIVELLLNRGATLNCKVQHGPSPIWSCLSTDALFTFEYAVNREPNLIGDNISNFVRTAYRCGATKIVKWLFDREKVSRNLLRENIITGATNGSLDLLKWTSSIGVDFTGIERDSKSPMDVAASEGHLECLKFFATPEGGSYNPHHPSSNPNANDPIGYASRFGHLQVVKYLHSLGVSLEPVRDRVAPLIFASFGGSLPVVQYLVENGAEVNVGLKVDYTPLRGACVRDNLDVAKYLVSKGAEKKESFKRAAVEACKCSSLTMLQWMTDEGHDWTLPDYKGKYPTMGAVRGGKIDNLEFLLRHNSPLVAFQGTTPVAYALTQGQHDMARHLIEQHGQKPHQEGVQSYFHLVFKIPQDSKKSTMDAMVSLGVPLRSLDDVRSALSTACSRDDLEGAKWLHRAGFSLTAPDKNGRTPIEVAATYGHSRIIDWIVRKVPLQTGKLQSALALATLQGNTVAMNRLQHIIQVLSA